MTVRKINKSWRVDIQHNHVRYRRKSPENSKAGAQAYEAQLRQKLAIGGEALAFAEPDKKKKEREQKFKEFSSEWLKIHVRSQNKHSEARRKKSVLQAHLVPFFGETQIDKISTYQIEQYKEKKIGEGLAPQTVNNHLAVLSAGLRTAQDWYELKKLPKMEKLTATPPETVFLLPEESARLLAHVNGLWRDIIFTALKTGLRRGELKALQWSDINWKTRVLTVRHSWCEYKKELSSPKSNLGRHIPLTDELYKRLLQLKKDTGFVFLDARSKKFCIRELARKIDEACKKAKIKRVTCHDLRHTFASHLAMAGAPLIAIQELLGHSDIKTTMRYAHIAPSTLRETVGLLEKRTPTQFGHYLGTRENQPNNIPLQASTWLF